ncbi:hypothetical protein [Clostridium zeae]|nr:hypothetical protein [Clostridium zeae]
MYEFSATSEVVDKVKVIEDSILKSRESAEGLRDIVSRFRL